MTQQMNRINSGIWWWLSGEERYCTDEEGGRRERGGREEGGREGGEREGGREGGMERWREMEGEGGSEEK